MKIGLIGISVRAAAEAISDRIPNTAAIDFFADHDTQLALPNRCFQISDWSQVQSVVRAIACGSEVQIPESPGLAKADHQRDDSDELDSLEEMGLSEEMGWIVTGGLELSPKILECISARGHRVLGCQVEALQFSKTPERWCSVLRESGESVPHFSRSSACPPGHWFLKETWGDCRWFWQAAVPGELASAIYLATPQGTELVGCTRLFCRPDFRYLGNLATPEWPEPVLREPIHRIGKTLAQAGQFQGLFGVDFVVDPSRQLWPIEINPRPTASVEVLGGMLQRNLFFEHLAACGWPLPRGSLKITEIERMAPQISFKHTLYNRGRPLTITDCFFNWLVDRQSFRSIDLKESGLLEVLGSDFDRHQRYWRQRLADIPRVGTTIPSGQPICTLLAQAAGFRGKSQVNLKRLCMWLHSMEDQVFSFGAKPN